MTTTDERIIRQGIVRQTYSNGTADVALPRRGACENCSEKGLCFGVGEDEPQFVRVTNPMGAIPGARVAVGYPSGSFLRASLTVYLLPLIGLLAGAVIGTLAMGDTSQVPAIAGAGLGFVSALGMSVAMDRRARRNPRYIPEIVEVNIAALACTLDLESGQSDHSVKI